MAATPTRVYLVELGARLALVRAQTPAAALSHVAREQSKVRVASQDDLILYLASYPVQDASTEPAQMKTPLVVDGGTAR